jgi:hypothetical protein
MLLLPLSIGILIAFVIIFAFNGRRFEIEFSRFENHAQLREIFPPRKKISQQQQ